MSIRIARGISSVLVPALLFLVTAAPVWAADPVTLQLQAPERAALGEDVTVTALLKDGKGAPVGGATIVLWSAASFLGTSGTVQLGRATTDAQGKAAFRYQPRAEGPVTLNAYFTGDSKHDAAQGSVVVAAQGSAQLYQETPPVYVPGINVWFLVALLGGVWGTYLAVMVLLTLIAREGAKASHDPGGHRG